MASKKRERLEVIRDIILAIKSNRNIKPTRLLYASNLSPQMFKEYINELITKGFIKIDDTDSPGEYRLDLPDAAVADGVDHVTIYCDGATNMVPWKRGIKLVDYDPHDSVRMGMAALPNAAAEAAGGLYTRGTGAGQIDQPANGTVASNPAAGSIEAGDIAAAAFNGKGDWNIGKTGYSLTQAFPTNFASLSINANGRVGLDLDNTEGGLAYGAEITGLNNLSVSDVWGVSLPGAYGAGTGRE